MYDTVASLRENHMTDAELLVLGLAQEPRGAILTALELPAAAVQPIDTPRVEAKPEEGKEEQDNVRVEDDPLPDAEELLDGTQEEDAAAAAAVQQQQPERHDDSDSDSDSDDSIGMYKPVVLKKQTKKKAPVPGDLFDTAAAPAAAGAAAVQAGSTDRADAAAPDSDDDFAEELDAAAVPKAEPVAAAAAIPAARGHKVAAAAPVSLGRATAPATSEADRTQRVDMQWEIERRRKARKALQMGATRSGAVVAQSAGREAHRDDIQYHRRMLENGPNLLSDVAPPASTASSAEQRGTTRPRPASERDQAASAAARLAERIPAKKRKRNDEPSSASAPPSGGAKKPRRKHNRWKSAAAAAPRRKPKATRGAKRDPRAAATRQQQEDTRELAAPAWRAHDVNQADCDAAREDAPAAATGGSAAVVLGGSTRGRQYPKASQADVDRVMEMGFEEGKAQQALEDMAGDLQMAVVALISDKEPSESPVSPDCESAAAAAAPLAASAGLHCLLEMGFPREKAQQALTNAGGDVYLASCVLMLFLYCFTLCSG